MGRNYSEICGNMQTANSYAFEWINVVNMHILALCPQHSGLAINFCDCFEVSPDRKSLKLLSFSPPLRF